MTITDELRVIVEAQVEKAVRDMGLWEKSMGGSQKKLEDLQKSVDKAANRLMLFSGGVAALGVAGLKLASDAEETNAKFNTAFRGIEKTASAVAASLQNDYGLSSTASEQLLSNTGDLLKGFGATASQALDLSTKAQKLAVDLTSYNNIQGGVSRSSEILTKAMLGEREALASLGIKISQADVDQRLLEKGQKDLTGRALLLAQANATLELAYQQSGDALGDFARTQDGFANQARVAKARMEDVAVTLSKDLIPIAAEAMKKVSQLASGFKDLDEGTKKLILTLAGIAVVVGPLAKVTSGILLLTSTIAKLALTNPVVLGIAAVTAAVALLGIAIAQTRAKAAAFTQEVWKDAQAGALASAKSFSDVKNILPGMTQAMYDAAKSTGNFQKAIDDLAAANSLRGKIAQLESEAKTLGSTYSREIGDALSILNAPLNSSSQGWFQGYSTDADRFNAALGKLNASIYDTNGILQKNQDYWAAVQSRSTAALKAALEGVSLANPEIEKLKKELAAIESGAGITGTAGTPGGTGDAKKTWQAWFEEITGVQQKVFGESGQKAAQAYIESLETEFDAAKDVGRVLGEAIDPVPYLKAQQESLRKSMMDMFAANKTGNINSPFTHYNESIQRLTTEYKSLTVWIKQAEAEQKKMNDRLADMEKAKGYIESLKTPYEQYLDIYKEIQRLQLQGMLTTQQAIALNAKAWDEYKDRIEKTNAEIKTFHDFVAFSVRDALVELTGISKDVAMIFGDLAAQLVELQINAAVDAFKQLGAAFKNGAISAGEFRDILAAYMETLLNQLPMLFVQAGLMMIAWNPANWPIGLGLIAAGLSGAFISGLVGSQKNSDSSSTTNNALGNAYRNGTIAAFANGAAFLNSIVSSPTLFAMANGGLGLMGEKGPEAVVPLARTSSGRLGIETTGSGASASVSVVVNNYSGEKATVTETTDEDGSRRIEVMIGEVVDKNLASGRHDRALRGSFGLARKGVRA